MARSFRDKDRQKQVVTADGQRVGRVHEVDDGRATVHQPDEKGSLTDEVKALLGWSEDDEHHELRRDQVNRYEDEAVHLSPLR